MLRVRMIQNLVPYFADSPPSHSPAERLVGMPILALLPTSLYSAHAQLTLSAEELWERAERKSARGQHGEVSRQARRSAHHPIQYVLERRHLGRGRLRCAHRPDTSASMKGFRLVW